MKQNHYLIYGVSTNLNKIILVKGIDNRIEKIKFKMGK